MLRQAIEAYFRIIRDLDLLGFQAFPCNLRHRYNARASRFARRRDYGYGGCIWLRGEGIFHFNPVASGITEFLFLERCSDPLADQALARSLCYPRRTHLSIIMKYLDRFPEIKEQVNLALRHHARNGNLKWVSLLLWAGGNGHIPLPEIEEEPDSDTDTTALEEAVRFRRIAVVEKIGIVPNRDDMSRMLEEACSAGDWPLIEKMLQLGAVPGSDNRKHMERLISQFEWVINPLWGIRLDHHLEDAFQNIPEKEMYEAAIQAIGWRDGNIPPWADKGANEQ